jgi:asparagine synthase (glutamine-hydrolysing)
MCGIAGFFGEQPRNERERVLRAMTDAIAHRGPDGEGMFLEGPVALGHRRLKVLDLTEYAAQPMISADRRFVMIYNGEVYNYRELRAELEADGCRVQSSGDTEVVLECLARFGTGMLERFNGMFALALWDRREQTLLLARDRYGIKPLYYAHRDGAVVFGSEVRAILSNPLATCALDPEGLVEYFTFQNFLSDRTLFAGIRLLPAGSSMLVSASDTELRRYWDYAFREDEGPASDGEWLEELDRLFRQSVRRQLVSDVNVGAYLSGGIDSGLINGEASKGYAALRSFTIGFEASTGADGDPPYADERARAEAMSSTFGTEHYEMVLKSGDMIRSLPSVVRHVEEPRMGQSYPNYFAAQLAAGFATVVLAGTGGDELFAGYPWRYYQTIASDSGEDYLEKSYRYWQRLIPAELQPRAFLPLRREIADVDTRSIFRALFPADAVERTSPESRVNAALYFEAKTFLHGLLVLGDKLSMAHSIEERVPFLDNDLVDFAMRLPVRLKLGNLREVAAQKSSAALAPFLSDTRDGKLLLRRYMEQKVSGEIAYGSKRGFSGPDAAWFRRSTADYVRTRLVRGGSPIYEYLDKGTTVTLLEEHLAGDVDRRLLVWSLLSFDEWCRQFLS